MTPEDEQLMGVALEQARAALDRGHELAPNGAGRADIPIGAVVARGGEVVAAAANERELRGDPTAHAEILALRAAGEKLGSWRLDDCTLYVTLEPCPMCAGAAVLARLQRIVYGPQDPRAGAAYSLYNIVQDPRLNHQVELTTGVRAEECAALLTAFFERKRS